ncbi:MAG: hypothetical protein RLW68_19835 [Devosia marina]|uniref:hypothetical protein n=1 Tax=Devosia marina TaxID=2683198 RepID=UPI0012FC54E6
MAKLIKFERRRTSAGAEKQIPGDAQILIFTGVRYERGTPSPPTNHSDNRRKRKRV